MFDVCSVFIEADYRYRVSKMTISDRVWECCGAVKYRDDVIIRE